MPIIKIYLDYIILQASWKDKNRNLASFKLITNYIEHTIPRCLLDCNPDWNVVFPSGETPSSIT